jgi:predicted nucleic acid-binding protein
VAYLIDTNLFLRLAQAKNPQRATAFRALRTLLVKGEELCYTPQVMAEFWNVATRPTTARGGLGLSPSTTERKAEIIERRFRLLPDSLGTYAEWRSLVVTHAVLGVAVHDAKLVASMKVHGVTHLLTFNTGDFTRYAGVITVTDPTGV